MNYRAVSRQFFSCIGLEKRRITKREPCMKSVASWLPRVSRCRFCAGRFGHTCLPTDGCGVEAGNVALLHVPGRTAPFSRRTRFVRKRINAKIFRHGKTQGASASVADCRLCTARHGPFVCCSAFLRLLYTERRIIGGAAGNLKTGKGKKTRECRRRCCDR